MAVAKSFDGYGCMAKKHNIGYEKIPEHVILKKWFLIVNAGAVQSKAIVVL